MGFFDTLLAFFVGKSIADAKKKPAHKSHLNDTSNNNYHHNCLDDDCDCEHEYCSHDSFDDDCDSHYDDSHDSFNDDYDSFNDDSFDDDRY